MVRRAASRSRTMRLDLWRLLTAAETPYALAKGVRAMFEEYNKRNKAIVAALELAAEGGWKAVTFPAIADAQQREPRRPPP